MRLLVPAKPATTDRRPRPLLIFAVVALLLLLAAACQPAPMATAPAPVQPTAAAASYPPEITTTQAAAKRDAGAFILDVREPDEWADFHVPGSTLIPLGELPARVSEVPKDKEVVVVCRSGNRSQAGRDVLSAAGYSQVTSMQGGLNKWKAEGLPTVSGK